MLGPINSSARGFTKRPHIEDQQAHAFFGGVSPTTTDMPTLQH
jgi:hypothetical protein